MKSRGLALIVVVGILGVLAILAVAFVAMAELERRASEQRVNAARAYLLARSGIEDALARLALGQDPAYGGEDWNGDGVLDGPEAGNEVFQRGRLNVEDCPVRHAMRPSFFAGDSLGKPRLAVVEGRDRGYSGTLSGDYTPLGNAYALKVQFSNAGIYINGGALDALDRDPDGPGATAADFPLNPNAAAEVAPLLPNGVPDHMDASMEGPNGFLVRLLNNLDAIITNSATSNLGVQIVESRPLGGYKSLDELKPILGQARFDQFKPYLVLHAWVDPKVVKPQPMDGRPQRWEDIDDIHRMGQGLVHEISGVKELPGGPLILNPGIAGHGTEADPWTQTVTVINAYEGSAVVLTADSQTVTAGPRTVTAGPQSMTLGPRTYPVRWERDCIHAASQLRPAPPAMEPRAPISVISASPEMLASVFLGLKGTYLEVWEGSAGWDGGFGWYTARGSPPMGIYPYPDRATEDTPWHRTRLDYGMTYGPATAGTRPWYGPMAYDPVLGAAGGTSVIQSASLGRLQSTAPITLGQARAIADRIHRRAGEKGGLKTWARFSGFVDSLPLWEDVNGDGQLDGEPYTVTGSGGTYTRRIYRLEDIDSDGRMARGTFAPGDAQVPGLTVMQKDVLRAMADPNTGLNDFNPDANLWKWVDKTDLCGIKAEPAGYAHTTELGLGDEAVTQRVQAVGRVTAAGGNLLALRQVGAALSPGGICRDTTQADFMRGFIQGQPVGALFQGPDPPYSVAGNQPLVSYPEPQTTLLGSRAADAAYDGQLSLGFISSTDADPTSLMVDTLHADLFDTQDAVPIPAAPDLRGPFHLPLLAGAGLPGTGNIFPDGVYSEKDRALKYSGVCDFPYGAIFYIACWVKPGWFPEASPGAHALISLSRAGEPQSYDIFPGYVPVDGIPVEPVGLYFVPARNNAWRDTMGPYVHDHTSTRGGTWPCHALLWGDVHSLYASDDLNRRGVEQPNAKKPVGRLEGHRWRHLAVMGTNTNPGLLYTGGASRMLVGGSSASGNGGGWNHDMGGILHKAIGPLHIDGTPNHLRFGEIAGEVNMNYTADATFAGIRVGIALPVGSSFIPKDYPGSMAAVNQRFAAGTGPAGLGRYYREDGASYTSSKLPTGIRPRRITWTEIPCDLWFDEDGDGWLGDPATGYKPVDDRDGNGQRDVRIALEVWDDRGMLARFDDPTAANRIPRPKGLVYYKAVFVNEWDATTRANYPLDVTPFLDDVTVYYEPLGGPAVLAWGPDED